jgi:ketosteroid isomerase-like protein
MRIALRGLTVSGRQPASERRALVANENEMNALADRMACAYEQGDLDGVAACYAPDAILWHNFDGSEQTVAEQLDATRWLGENLRDLKYEVVARHFWDDGYVQQQVVHGTLIKNGEPFAMPTCMNVTVRDGLVTRLDEYLDSAHLQPLQAD